MATQSRRQTQIARIPAGVNMAHNPVTIGTPEQTVAEGLEPRWLKYGGLLINGLAESYEDPQTGKRERRWIPRPIISARASGTAITPKYVTRNVRGLWHWDYGGSSPMDFAFIETNATGGEIRRNTGATGIFSTALVTGLTTGIQSLEAGGTAAWDGTNRYFVISEAASRPYYINSSFTATQIADTDCPSGTGTSPYIAYMDGALFVAKNLQIHNSEFGSLTNWPGYSRTKEQYPEDIQALVKHHNSIVAFGKSTTEFFFNAGYSGTSPLNRQEAYASRIGLAVLGTGGQNITLYTEIDDKVYFLGRSTGQGEVREVGLYVLDNFKIKNLSTPYITTMLGLAPYQIGPITNMKYRGHSLVLMSVRASFIAFGIAPTTAGQGNLDQTDLVEFTLVYDIGEDYWSIWTARHPTSLTTKSFNVGETSGNNYSQMFPLEYLVANGGSYTGIHTDTLDTYTVQSNLPAGWSPAYTLNDYQESTCNIDFLIRYPTLDFGSMKEKSISKAFMVGLQNYDSGTPADINTYVFNSVYKESTGAYPTAIATKSYDDSMLTNLSTGRKFIIEQQWSGGTVTGIDSLELHVVDGEN